MSPQEIVPGTLDLLILKAVSLGELHGYGILLRIEQLSGEALRVPQGSLYPALRRLENAGLLRTSWGVSELNRRARFYSLSATGEKRLAEETERWREVSLGIHQVLATEGLT